MPSQSLQAFVAALDEVSTLGEASHPTLGPKSPESLRLARAVGRGQVVLLSSHFERYIYAMNEELVTNLNTAMIPGSKLPNIIRLQHSAAPIDEMAKTGWEHRSNLIISFVAKEGWIWNQGTGLLAHDRLLTWMKAPSPDNLLRYFKSWGIKDIFRLVTRKEHTRTALWLGLKGLVDLRNNIAHGDYGAQVTQSDVRRYIGHTRLFCERADKRVSTHIAAQFQLPAPW